MVSQPLQVKALPLLAESKLHPDDHQIGGTYVVQLSDQVPHQLLADAALDVFHGAVAVKNLEDFSFEVWQEGKQLRAGTSQEDYTFIDEGEVVSGPWTNFEDGIAHTEA